MQRNILLPLVGGIFAVAASANVGNAAVSANHLAAAKDQTPTVNKICYRYGYGGYADAGVPVRQYRPVRYYRPWRYYGGVNYYRPVRFYRPWRRW